MVTNNLHNPQRYPMRAREPQVVGSMAPAAEPGMRQTTSSSSSPPGFQTSDFPSLGGSDKSESSSEGTKNKLMATPWARVVGSADKAVNNCDQVQAPLPSTTSSDIKEEKGDEKVVQ